MSHYLFGLPTDLIDNLEAFKLDFEEPVDIIADLSDSEDALDASSDEENETSKDIIKLSNLAVTQYSDVQNDDDESIEKWQWSTRAHITGSPYVYYSQTASSENNNSNNNSKVLAVYKSWFDLDALVAESVQCLRQLPLQGKSCVLLVNSGNFAGIIVEHKRLQHKANISNPAANMIILESKTFHRYTTRRKQGGSQSASDATRGKANSAGSTIRRANERALQSEIRELLASWAGHLKDCYRIFYKAPGKYNKQLICGYSDAPIIANDKRLAKIPFATGKPSLLECKNSWLQLTQASWVDPPKPPSKTSSKLPSKQSKLGKDSHSNCSSRQATNSPEPPSPEELMTGKIVELIKRSKLPALKQVFHNEIAMQFDFRLQPEFEYVAYPTALLYAAYLNKANVVTQLIKWGANPLIKNGLGQTIGDLVAGNLKTKQALQTVRYDLGESKWAWNQAKIGPPMSKEDLLNMEAQEKLKLREEQEAAAAELEKEEHHRRMERLISKHGSGKLVGGLYEASRGLSAEDLKQVERERRARAAEARIKRLN